LTFGELWGIVRATLGRQPGNPWLVPCRLIEEQKSIMAQEHKDKRENLNGGIFCARIGEVK